MGPTTAQSNIFTQAIVGVWAAIFEQMNINALPTIAFGIERELVLGIGLQGQSILHKLVAAVTGHFNLSSSSRCAASARAGCVPVAAAKETPNGTASFKVAVAEDVGGYSVIGGGGLGAFVVIVLGTAVCIRW